jgi:hypothetical protein
VLPQQCLQYIECPYPGLEPIIGRITAGYCLNYPLDVVVRHFLRATGPCRFTKRARAACTVPREPIKNRALWNIVNSCDQAHGLIANDNGFNDFRSFFPRNSALVLIVAIIGSCENFFNEERHVGYMGLGCAVKMVSLGKSSD